LKNQHNPDCRDWLAKLVQKNEPTSFFYLIKAKRSKNRRKQIKKGWLRSKTVDCNMQMGKDK